MLTIGEILRHEREEKGISLIDVEKKIKIREKFLKAIEENKWDIFSSKIYIEGIIRNYASILGLDSKKILIFFRRDYEKKEEPVFKRQFSRNQLIPETKKYLRVAIISVFILFAIYFGYQLKIYLSPPKVTIVSPTKNTFKNQDRVKIIGRTEKEATINIFGDRVYQDKNGVFIYDFPLNPGKNELVIEVIGANGKKTVIKKEFFLTP